jgi:hypothetical protein
MQGITAIVSYNKSEPTQPTISETQNEKHI